ncbi:MAG: transcriptional regulator [Clostridiales bacterium 38-18]|nr:MAG: transcriptional regulator [Clostridiales bacterium 38-18]
MQTLTSLFKLLSDESRLRVLMLLKHGPLCVCEFSGILQMPQPKVSKSLAKLKDLNLVTDTRVEKYVYYSLTDELKLLTQILEEIQIEIEKYPTLNSDFKRLSLKTDYLNQCIPEFKLGG